MVVMGVMGVLVLLYECMYANCACITTDKEKRTRNRRRGATLLQ